jgi:rhamnogalacturonan acetylesterase
MKPLLLLAAALLLSTTSAPAQIKTPDAPPQTNLPKQAPLNPKLPTLFIVGDSTASNGPNLGWGDHFAPLFDTTRINIANRARAGRSSRSYFNEGLWDATLAQIKPGDFVLFQMGHNDGGASPESILKDLKMRNTIKGLGPETAEFPLTRPFTTGPLAGQSVETIHTFGWYMRRYFADTRAKGATPILLTPTVRNIWKPDATGQPQIEHDMGFKDIDTSLSQTEHVPLANVAALQADYFESLGPEKTALLFPIDHTHTSPEGADINAHLVAQALRDLHSPVAAYLKP